METVFQRCSMSFDIVAFDSEEFPVLLAEIKLVKPAPGAASQMIAYLKSTIPPTSYGLIVDPENLTFYQLDSETPVIPVARIGTAEVARRYDPDYEPNEIFDSYLGTLIEVWLRDLAIHWDSASPPATELMESIGLVPRLNRGTIAREVRLAVYPLS